MKVKTRPEHASVLAMNDWLAELHDAESAEPAGPDANGPGYAVPASYAVSASYAAPGSYAAPASYAVPASSRDQAVQASYVRAVPTGPGYTVPVSPGEGAGSARPEVLAGPVAPAPPAATALPAVTAPPARTTLPAALPRPAAPAAPAGPAGAVARAVIGDQLRIPIMWCEMGSCVSWHADPAALGEADARARAIAAGWRIDAFGRLACPRCQQTAPGYRTACQVVPWDRSNAIETTAPMPVVPHIGNAGRAALRTSRDPGRAARGYPPLARTQLEWSHDFPADEGMPADTSRSRGLVFSAVRAWRARGGGRQAAPGRASEHGENPMIAGCDEYSSSRLDIRADKLLISALWR